tara:strand:+ start:56 stop:670 length:615 start_codon:yes stop_codon:yes gene_type:complete
MKAVYIYEILDDDDNCVYVGETMAPKQRMVGHYADSGYTRMKILEVCDDREYYWINKRLSEGCTLGNNIHKTSDETWEVGDIVHSHSQKSKYGHQIRHKQTGVTYRSGYYASKVLPDVGIDVIYFMKKSPDSKYHKLFEFVDEDMNNLYKPTRVKQRLRHKQTGVVYRSGLQASKEVENVTAAVVQCMKQSPKSKYHKLFELID